MQASPLARAIKEFVPDSPEPMPGSEAFLNYLDKMMSLTQIGEQGNVDELLSTQTRKHLTSSFYNSPGHSNEYSPASTPKDNEQLPTKYEVDPVLLQALFKWPRTSNSGISSSGQSEEEEPVSTKRNNHRGFRDGPLNQGDLECTLSRKSSDSSCPTNAAALLSRTHAMRTSETERVATQEQQQERHSASSCYSEDRQQSCVLQDGSSQTAKLCKPVVSSPYSVT